MIVTTTGLRINLRDRGREGSLGDRAAFCHVFIADEYDFLLSRISAGDVVIDAGANIGCFALRAALRVGPRGVVIAVEPEPSNVACLKGNIQLNAMSNVIVVERALDGVHDKTVHVIGTGTTARVEETGTVIDVYDRTAGISRTAVRTTTLDEVIKDLSIERLDAIKMDIEGAENSVFSTASTSSALGIATTVAVEVHDRDGPRVVQSRLRAEGYSYVGQVKPQSKFLTNSIRRGARRPDLMLMLYGMDIVPVAARMLAAALNQRPDPDSDILGIVYAAR